MLDRSVDNPSAMAGCVKIASRSESKVIPPSIAVWTTAINSPASAPNAAKPRMRLLSSSISIFRKPRVSERVFARSTPCIGIFATRYRTPNVRASNSLSPTRVNSGSVKRQKGIKRFCVVRFPPLRLSRTIRKSSKATCVNCGLPAHSPIAHTAGDVVSSLSFTLT